MKPQQQDSETPLDKSIPVSFSEETNSTFVINNAPFSEQIRLSEDLPAMNQLRAHKRPAAIRAQVTIVSTTTVVLTF